MKTKIVVFILAAIALIAAGASADIVTRTIQHENHDAEEYLNTIAIHGRNDYPQGSGWVVSSDLEMGSEFNDGLCWVGLGLQYDQLGIPPGWTITSAKLTFTVDETVVSHSSNDFTVFGEAVGNASLFNYIPAEWNPLAPFDISSRPRTCELFASAGWSPVDPAVGETLDTPDISAVIQEIVDRGDWSENNRITLMVFPDVYLDLPDPTTGGTTTITGHTYEGGPGFDSATLTVEFEDLPIVKLPSPENGATVPAGDVRLSWTNPDPNDPDESSVWVNVWFGTDPNDYNDFDKIVDANENTSYQTVSAPTAGTYYWKVDSYIYGDPAVVDYSSPDPNFPQVMEGRMWRFYAADDFPPSVDAGSDWITWSGQKVPLGSDVDDDGISDLTYAWSTNDPNVVFIPNDGGDGSTSSVPDPNVVITSDPALIPIGNPGFEIPPLVDGYYGFVWAPFDSWDWIGQDWCRAYNAQTYMFPNEAPEGFNIGCVEAEPATGGDDLTGGLVQVLTSDLAAETTYTLTVKVGNPIEFYYYSTNNFPGYRVQLLAGGTVLAEDYSPDPNSVEDPNSLVQPGTWVTSTVEYTSGFAINDPNIGQPLEVRLLNMGYNAESVGADHAVVYDDVKLYSDPPTGGGVTVELKLGVNDESNPTPVEDTIEIDVYDNPCLAAIAKLKYDYPAANLSWLDGDCSNGADLEDFAEIAAIWQAGRGAVFDDIVVMAILWLDGTDALTEPAAIDKTPTVSTDKASYDPNETIVYSYSNAGGGNLDWIGVFEAGAPNESELYYYYLNGREHGSIIENDPQLPVGSYEARLFFNDSYALEAKTSFDVQ